MIVVKKHTNILMVIVILSIGIANFFAGERLQVGNGLGWDGQFHGDLAKDWPNKVFVEKKFYNSRTSKSYNINKYNIQRILPSGIIHYSLRLLRIPLENHNIVKAFLSYNLLLLGMIAFCWGKIADLLKVSCRGKWLCFLGLFCNFALTFNFYYPNLTDVSAFALGMLMVYFYLTNLQIGILIVCILGAFTWPTLIYMGFLLYIFPVVNQKPIPCRFNLHIYAAVFGAFFVLLGLVYVKFIAKFSHGPVSLPSAINLSIIIVVVYIFFGLKKILNNGKLFDIKTIFQQMKFKNLITFMCCFVFIKVFIYYLNMPEGKNDIGRFIKATLAISTNQPFIFGLAHVLYYGPIILLTFILWQRISEKAHSFGYGMTFTLILTLILSLSSESRQIINFFPLVLVVTVKAVETLNWQTQYFWVFAFVSLLYSKLWLRFNNVPLPLKDAQRHFQEFPWQKFFSSVGYQMSLNMYFIQGAIVFVTGILYYFLLVRDCRNT